MYFSRGIKKLLVVLILVFSQAKAEQKLNIDNRLSENKQEKISLVASQVSEALSLSVEVLDDIISLSEVEVESEKEKRLFNIWKATFLGSDPKIIRKRFQYLKDQFEKNLTHIRYAEKSMCRTDSQNPHRQSFKVAFVLMLRDRLSGEMMPYDTQNRVKTHDAILNLCDHWFDSIGSIDQVASFVHELSHWYLKTRDYAYMDENVKFLNLTALERKNNADTYALFIKKILRYMS